MGAPGSIHGLPQALPQLPIIIMNEVIFMNRLVSANQLFSIKQAGG
jgi:hypothetical protein